MKTCERCYSRQVRGELVHEAGCVHDSDTRLVVQYWREGREGPGHGKATGILLEKGPIFSTIKVGRRIKKIRNERLEVYGRTQKEGGIR